MFGTLPVSGEACARLSSPSLSQHNLSSPIKCNHLYAVSPFGGSLFGAHCRKTSLQTPSPVSRSAHLSLQALTRRSHMAWRYGTTAHVGSSQFTQQWESREITAPAYTDATHFSPHAKGGNANVHDIRQNFPPKRAKSFFKRLMKVLQ